MVRKTKPINLALQGGGTHGAFAWGILDKLLEDGRIDIGCISATSAGTMNAVVLAQGLMNGDKDEARELLRSFWKAISDAGKIFSPVKSTPFEQMMGVQPEASQTFFMFDMIIKLFSPYQFNPTNMNPLRDTVSSMVDFEKLKVCQNPRLFICATNVRSGKIKVFKNEEVTLDAVMASCCLPFLFQAVEIENNAYWDGGYMGNPALFPLIYDSVNPDILIIHINPIHRDEIPKTAAEIMNRMNEVSFNSSLMREMRAVAFVSKMLDEGWIKDEYSKNMRRVYMHAIRADKVMRNFTISSKLNTEWDFLCYLHEQGRDLASDWIDRNFKSLGKRSTIDINEYL